MVGGASREGGGRSGEPRRLGDILAPALDRIAGSDQARAYGAWARAAGAQVSGGAHPRFYSRGVLTVECTSSVWANELTYLSAEILRRMDSVAPGHPVKRLRFMVASAPREQEPEASAAKQEDRGKEPASPDDDRARAGAQGVRAERLRAAVEAALKVSDEGSGTTSLKRTPPGSQK